VTNGGREGGEALVRNAGLDDVVERVFGVDEAHAWDVVGAVRAGMEAVWIDGSERVWPFPDELAAHTTVPSLAEVLA
jgi:FMN phosphatase YigB (HAD superfamily)